VPPDGSGALCAPAAVELALQQSLGTLAAQAGERGRCPMCRMPFAGRRVRSEGRSG
jgi:hypothetical protein